MMRALNAFHTEEKLNFVSSGELAKIIEGDQYEEFKYPTSRGILPLEGRWLFKNNQEVLKISTKISLPYKEKQFAFLTPHSGLIINPHTKGIWATHPAKKFLKQPLGMDEFEKIVNRKGYHPGIIKTSSSNEIIKIPRHFIVEVNQLRFIAHDSECISIGGYEMIAIVRDNIFRKKEKNWIHAIYVSEGTPFEPHLLKWLETHL